MPREERNRSIYYRRAIWAEEHSGTVLESLLTNAHKKLETSGERDFGTTMTHYQGVDFKFCKDGGILLNIGKYAPGEEGSTIQKPSKELKGKVGIQKPEQNTEFMDGNIFVYVNQNHVLLLPSGAGEGAANKYIWYVLRATEQQAAANNVKLERIANASKVRMIEREKIQSVALNASLYEASLLIDDPKKPQKKLLAQLADAAKAIIHKDKELSDITKSENLNIQVRFSFDGATARRQNDKSYGLQGLERLEGLSQLLVEDDDAEGFIITTQKGNQIKSDEINIKKTITLPKFGKTVQQSEAWNSLTAFYDELKASGILEQ